jgi:hypothetical protein
LLEELNIDFSSERISLSQSNCEMSLETKVVVGVLGLVKQIGQVNLSTANNGQSVINSLDP